MEATCNCGAVRVKVTDDELFTRPRGHICHCSNCRKTAGSLIESSKVTITGAENLTQYNDGDSLSGNTVERYFCKTCGNPIKSETEKVRGMGKVILKLGIFERIPQPEFESFVQHRQTWLKDHHANGAFKIALGGEKMEGS